MGETDNKPLHKTYACWIVISDMKTKIQEWGRDGKRGEKVTVGRVVKEVVSGLKPDKSQWEELQNSSLMSKGKVRLEMLAGAKLGRTL